MSTHAYAVLSTDDATGQVLGAYGPLPELETPDPSSLGRMNQYGAAGWRFVETHLLPAPNDGVRVITLELAQE